MHFPKIKPNTVANRVPLMGGGLGIQIPISKKNRVLEFTGVFYKPQVYSPKIEIQQDKHHTAPEKFINAQVIRNLIRTDDVTESKTLYKTFVVDGLFKQYWSTYKNLNIFLGGGGFLSFHRKIYTKRLEDAAPVPILFCGYGGVIGGGIERLFFSRVSLDCFFGGRFPIPFFCENYIKHCSLSMKLTLSYRFSDRQ